MKIEYAGLTIHTDTKEEAYQIINLCRFNNTLKGGQLTSLPNLFTSINISDPQTHALLIDVRTLLRQTVNLLTLQLKGEFIFMADITTELQTLKDAVTAETNQDAALATAIDGAVSTMASGVAEIKALAQQILTVANDPQMVRDLAAQLKIATDTQAGKLAALQAASGDLASAVVANTQGSAQESTGTPTPATAPTSESAPTPAPTPEPAPQSTSMDTTNTEDATAFGDTGVLLGPSEGPGQS